MVTCYIFLSWTFVTISCFLAFKLNSNLTEDMQIKEAKITVNSPSDEGTETGKLERIINLDGEIFHLQQPEFHVV